MTQATGQTFRVFVSSTFSDLKAERDALQAHVFPRLRELCERHGARFQAIDLRWGVSQQASRDQQTMNICLGEIERCQEVTPRPNFIVLLGDRYGWCPPPPQIPADEFERILATLEPEERRLLLWEEDGGEPGDAIEMVHWDAEKKAFAGDKGWYHSDDNAVPAEYVLQSWDGFSYEEWGEIEKTLHAALARGAEAAGLDEDARFKYWASATHQEIAAGAMSEKAEPEQVFAFFRQIDTDTLPRNEKADGFIDLVEAGEGMIPDAQARQSLADLKADLRSTLGEHNVQKYEVEWTDEGPATNHINRLCDDVQAALQDVIEKQLAALEDVDPLEAEVAAHQAFGQERARFFTGRTDYLQRVAGYLKSSYLHPLAIWGDPGSGKSALLAKAVQEAREMHGDEAVVYRFVGATPESSSGRALLESLCRQISRRYGADETDIPLEYRDLAREFPKRLALATANKPLVLFIDALDQLSGVDNARALTWLPRELPDNVRLVTSTLPGECLDVLRRKLPRRCLVQLEPMTDDEAEDLLDLWLEDDERTLQWEQRRDVLTDTKPLYLKLAFEEARHWHSYDGLPKGADGTPGLSDDIDGIIRDLFARLSSKANHGEVLVSCSLGYLAAAKNGLTEDELLDVLARDIDVYTWFLRSLFHTPPDLFQRVQKHLEKEHGAPVSEKAAGEWLSALRDKENERDLRAFLSAELTASGALRLPVALWSRLYTDLAPYLTHRAADDTSLLTFYHRTSFGQAVGQAYLDEDVREARHRAMASYFAEQPLFRGEDGGRQPNLRKLSEFPYQLAHGHLWDGLQEILTDFDFLQAKVGAVGPQSLIEDYDQANAAGYEERDLPLVRGALQLSTHVLAQDDTQFAGQLVGRLMGQEVPAIQDLVGQAKGWSGAPWLRPLRPSLTPPGGPLSHTLEAHAGSVEALAIFDEGRRAITGAEDATLVIWDLEREGQRWTLKGHGGTVRDVAVFAGGKRALSGSDDKTLRLWDLETGQALQILHGHSDAVSTVAVFAGGERALSGSQDSTLRVWDLGSGELLDTLRGHTHAVNAVAVSADGQRAYSGSSDKTLRIWDLEAGQELRRVECQAGIIEALALFDGDGRAVTASFGQLTVWNLGTGKQDFELDAHLSPVQALAVYKDRSWAVSGSLYGGTIRCWDLNSGEQLFVLEGYLDGVTRIAVSSDGRRLVATGDDGSLRVLALETGDELLHTIRDQDVIAVSRDGQRALCRSRTEDWRLRVFELPSGREVRTIGGHWSDMKHIRFITRAAIFDCGERAVTCASDALKVWDLETGCTIQTLEGHGEWDVWALAVTPDGTRAISGSDDKTLKVWDLKSGEHLHTLKGHKGAVLGVAVIPGVRHAVSASHDGTLKVWNLETGQALQTLEGHRQAVTAVAVSPDGATAVSGSEEGTLKLWDLRSGQSVRSFGGHESGVTAVDVFAGGELAVSASHDSNLKIWDLDRGIAVRTLTAHSDSIDNVTVLSDGRRAVSTSCDHTVRMWNLDAMDASSITRAHNGTVESTTVLANGRRAVSTSSHPTELRAWSMETAGRTPALLWQVGPRDTVKVFSDTGFVVVLPRLSLLEHKTLCVLWNLTDGTRLASVECPFGLTPQWADPQRVLLSVKDRLLVWNRQNGRSLRELKPNASFSSAQINAVAIYAGGKRAISAGADGEFRVWDLESGQGLYAIQAHQDSVTALTVSADSRRAVSASKDSTLCLWNLEKSQIRKVATLSGHRQGVRSIRLFAGDRRAISASDDSTIKIWSLETGNVEYTLNGHTSLITGLRVSADGMWAVSCSWDHTLRLWDLDNRNEVVTFRADAGLVDCDLTPDGRTLLAGDRLGQVHILRLVQVAHSPIVVRASHNGQGMLSVACLRCRASAAIEESDLGKVVTCPDCGAELHVNRLTVNVSNTWLAAEESASEELGGRLRKESEPSDVRAIVAHNLRQYIRSVSALESQEKSTHNKPAADEGHEQPDDK